MKPTFLEVLIVVVIIGIVAAIAIPKFQRVVAVTGAQVHIGTTGVRRVDDPERGVTCYLYSGISCVKTR